MTLDFSTLWQALDKGGVIALCVFIIVAFVKGWIVPRWAYNSMVEQMEFFKSAALRGTELADRATRVIEKKVIEKE